MFSTLSCLLALSILLGIVYILVAGSLLTARRGLSWIIGNRDGEPPAPSIRAARAQRASANFLETFPFFAAAVVCAIAIDRQGYLAETGAQLYFWARVVYLPVYIIGIPLVRSLLWTVSMVGLVMVVVALF